MDFAHEPATRATHPPIPSTGIPAMPRHSSRRSWTWQAHSGHRFARIADEKGFPESAAWQRRAADFAQDVADAVRAYGVESREYRAALAAYGAEAALRERLNARLAYPTYPRRDHA